MAPPPRRITRINPQNPTLPGGPPQKKAPPPPKAAQRKANCCDEPKVEDDGEGHMVCSNCFTQVGESNIVADVTFQEDSRGAATVQGGFIADNARHAQTMGLAARRMGGGEKNNLQERERNGRRALSAMCPRLGIPESVSNQAAQIFVLAAQYNFSAGRKTDEVVAACLFAACRRQKENTILLIDISELLQLNVFRLGEVYKEMCHKLYIEDHNVGYQHMVDVESLILKYCRRLEFGDATRQVAEDAVKIMRRMKRDWMVTGRHPAGLCGACIILAARMNNFCRTTKEIVYVSKVADITIMKRVEEFRRTKSAALTVDQFREYGSRLKHQADPPSIIASQRRKEKLAADRKQREAARGDIGTMRIAANGSCAGQASPAPNGTPLPEQSNGGEPARKRVKFAMEDSPAVTQQSGQNPASDPRTAQTNPTPTSSQPQPRRDAEGFAIPAIPIDPMLAEPARPQQEPAQPAQPVKRKRGRPKKTPQPVVEISREELAEEEELEREIQESLQNDELVESVTEQQKVKEEETVAKAEAASKEIAAKEMLSAAANTKTRRENEGVTWMDNVEHVPGHGDTAADLEKEFENDPEVQRCMLTEEERKLKESIWVRWNEDWLRQRHEKELLAAVAKATGQPEKGASKRGAKGAKGKGWGKKGDTIGETGSPINTPADANQAMLDKRGKGFSKFLDYEKLQKAYGPASSTASSRAGSQAPSSRASTPATSASAMGASPSPAPMGIGGGSPPPPPPSKRAKPGAAHDDDEDAGPYDEDGVYNSDGGGDYYPQDGEEDYEAAIDPSGGVSLMDDYGDDDYEGGEFE